MTEKEAIEYIKSYPEVYFQKAEKSGYVCPLCKNGMESDGTEIEENSKDRGHYKCFKCGRSEDIFDFIGFEYNFINYNDKLKEAFSIYRITVDDKKYKGRINCSDGKEYKRKKSRKKVEDISKKADEYEDYIEYFKKANESLNKDYEKTIKRIILRNGE
jgi:hypothetical protein